MIDFELSPKLKATQKMLRGFAEQAMRPQARKYDEEEHEKPWDLINMVHSFMKGGIGGSMGGGSENEHEGGEKKRSENKLATSDKSSLGSSEGFVVVWATVDAKAGRAGIKPFIVEHGTPGMEITK